LQIPPRLCVEVSDDVKILVFVGFTEKSFRSDNNKENKILSGERGMKAEIQSVSYTKKLGY